MELDDSASILATADFFTVCNDEQRRLLAFTCDRRIHRNGEILCKAGENGDGAYILISGTLEVTQKRDGPNKVRLVKVPGTVIGELALVLERPRRVTVKAVTSAQTLFVPRKSFDKLLRQFPDMAQRTQAYMAQTLTGYVTALGTVQKRMKAE